MFYWLSSTTNTLIQTWICRLEKVSHFWWLNIFQLKFSVKRREKFVRTRYEIFEEKKTLAYLYLFVWALKLLDSLTTLPVSSNHFINSFRIHYYTHTQNICILYANTPHSLQVIQLLIEMKKNYLFLWYKYILYRKKLWFFCITFLFRFLFRS